MRFIWNYSSVCQNMPNAFGFGKNDIELGNKFRLTYYLRPLLECTVITQLVQKRLTSHLAGQEGTYPVTDDLHYSFRTHKKYKNTQNILKS